MNLKLKNEEIKEILNISTPDFPKYVAPILNLANRYAKGTVPEVVGQVTELIQEFSGKTIEEWEEWYIKRNPAAIRDATEKIARMVNGFKETIKKIDRNLIEMWVKDLVIIKTFIGLRFQEAILKKIASIKKCSYRLAVPEEEAKGIDGYIDDTPISIKPATYRDKPELLENTKAEFIFYEKKKDGIEIIFRIK